MVMNDLCPVCGKDRVLCKCPVAHKRVQMGAAPWDGGMRPPPPRPECARLWERVAELERCRCAKPGVESCAKQWEADHQRRALEEHGLADEFPYGCDSIDSVAEALLAARARVADVEGILERVRNYGKSMMGERGTVTRGIGETVVKLIDAGPNKQTAPPTGE